MRLQVRQLPAQLPGKPVIVAIDARHEIPVCAIHQVAHVRHRTNAQFATQMQDSPRVLLRQRRDDFAGAVVRGVVPDQYLQLGIDGLPEDAAQALSDEIALVPRDYANGNTRRRHASGPSSQRDAGAFPARTPRASPMMSARARCRPSAAPER